MSKVGIVTDSIACLEPEKAREYGIKTVPISLYINGREYHDRVDLSPDDFWKLYPDIKEFSTAAPGPAEYIKAFEELSGKTDSIAGIFVSKSLSATYEAAVQARDLFLKDHPGMKIEVIDSRVAVGAEGFVALEMARAAEAGKSLEQIVSTANEMIPKVRYILALETLTRLIKIGRAPKTAYIGELFQVKPLIGQVNNTGVVENLGKARGTEKAMQKLIEIAGTYIDKNKPAHIHVHYTNSLEEGEQLKKLVTANFNVTELYFTPFSPVICGAIGPAFSIAFYT